MTVGRIEGHCPRKGVRSAVVKHSSSPEREWIAHCPGLARLPGWPGRARSDPSSQHRGTAATRQISGRVACGLALPATSRVSALDRLRAFWPEPSARWDRLRCACWFVNPVQARPLETEQPTEIDDRPVTAGGHSLRLEMLKATPGRRPGREAPTRVRSGLSSLRPGGDEVLIKLAWGLEEAPRGTTVGKAPTLWAVWLKR